MSRLEKLVLVPVGTVITQYDLLDKYLPNEGSPYDSRLPLAQFLNRESGVQDAGKRAINKRARRHEGEPGVGGI